MASSSNDHSSTTNNEPSSFLFHPCPENAVLNRRRYCRCPHGPHVSVLRVSQVPASFNRIFFSCRNYVDRTNKGCGFFLWAVDEGVALRSAKAIHDMQNTLEHVLMTSICTSANRMEQKLLVMDLVLSSIRKLERKLMELERRDMVALAAPRYRSVAVIVVLICLLYNLVMRK